MRTAAATALFLSLASLSFACSGVAVGTGTATDGVTEKPASTEENVAAPAPEANTPAPPASECTAIANIAPWAAVTRTAADRVATGGTVTDGTYVLTAIEWRNASDAELETRMKRTIRVTRRKLETVTEVDGETTYNSGTLERAGETTLYRAFSCPAPASEDSPEYSATSNTLALTFPNHSTYTYTKQ